jgi:hypothetical protein
MGLLLNMQGSVGTSPGNGFSNTPKPSTAYEAGFGSMATQPGDPNSTNALVPDDPFGVAFWAGVVSLGLLLVIRHSLPA